MGYRGKLAERRHARLLRRTGLPLAEIAARLGVSKSSVSLWVRDVSFDPLPARLREQRPPHDLLLLLAATVLHHRRVSAAAPPLPA